MSMKILGCIVHEHKKDGTITKHDGRVYACSDCGHKEPCRSDNPKPCPWCSAPKHERFMSYSEAEWWRTAIHHALREDPWNYSIVRVLHDAFNYGYQKDLTALGDAFLRMSRIGMNDPERNRIYLACGLLLLAMKGPDHE